MQEPTVFEHQLSLPSHEGSGLKSLISARAVGRRGLPSHEGSGLKLFLCFGQIRPFRLPSHEGSGLKSPITLKQEYQHMSPLA